MSGTHLNLNTLDLSETKNFLSSPLPRGRGRPKACVARFWAGEGDLKASLSASSVPYLIDSPSPVAKKQRRPLPLGRGEDKKFLVSLKTMPLFLKER